MHEGRIRVPLLSLLSCQHRLLMMMLLVQNDLPLLLLPDLMLLLDQLLMLLSRHLPLQGWRSLERAATRFSRNTLLVVVASVVQRDRDGSVDTHAQAHVLSGRPCHHPAPVHT